MITLSGLKPHEDIDIEFIGIREGEKLFEDLEMRGEDLRRTRHPKIFIGNLSPPTSDFVDAVRELEELASLGLDAEIRGALQQLLPEAELESHSRALRILLDRRLQRNRRSRRSESPEP